MQANPVVKCSVCGCLCTGTEAGRHRELLKHNNWELIYEARSYLLCLVFQREVALTNKDDIEVIEKGQ